MQGTDVFSPWLYRLRDADGIRNARPLDQQLLTGKVFDIKDYLVFVDCRVFP